MMISLYRKYWKNYKIGEVDIHFCGWLDYKNQIFTGKEVNLIAEELKGFNKADFAEFLKSSNGNFSLIIVKNNQILIGGDRVRTYPVLYFKKGNDFVVTDDIIRYQKENNITMPTDDDLVLQYFVSNYSAGPYTVFKDVYSIQSGELVVLDRDTLQIKREQYFEWAPNINISAEPRNLVEEARILDEITESVIKRMIGSCPDVNRWIVPLSGGYDSRTILNYLHKLGVKNVVCYTYGVENNPQSITSKEVAGRLGYEWHFVNPANWAEQFLKTGLREKYREYAFNGSSAVHMQDLIPIFALKEQGIIKSGDVFVPGISYDFLCGAALYDEMREIKTKEEAVQDLKRFYHAFPLGTKDVGAQILKIIKDYKVENNQISQCFDWKEGKTKSNTNWIRCYEFFDFRWRIPLWDDELIQYWTGIEYDERKGRKLYTRIFEDYMQVKELNGVPFHNNFVAQSLSLKSKIINKIPVHVKMWIRNLGVSYNNKEVYNEGLENIYDDKTERISEVIKSGSFPKRINKFLLKYYKNQQLKYLSLDSITTILNIRQFANSGKIPNQRES